MYWCFLGSKNIRLIEIDHWEQSEHSLSFCWLWALLFDSKLSKIGAYKVASFKFGQHYHNKPQWRNFRRSYKQIPQYSNRKLKLFLDELWSFTWKVFDLHNLYDIKKLFSILNHLSKRSFANKYPKINRRVENIVRE